MHERSVIYVITNHRRGGDAIATLAAPVTSDVIVVDKPSALLDLPLRAGAGCVVLDVDVHEPYKSNLLRRVAQSQEWIPFVFVALDDHSVSCMRPVLGGWEPVDASDHNEHLRLTLLACLACDDLAREGRRDHAALNQGKRGHTAAVVTQAMGRRADVASEPDSAQ